MNAHRHQRQHKTGIEVLEDRDEDDPDARFSRLAPNSIFELSFSYLVRQGLNCNFAQISQFPGGLVGVNWRSPPAGSPSCVFPLLLPVLVTFGSIRSSQDDWTTGSMVATSQPLLAKISRKAATAPGCPPKIRASCMLATLLSPNFLVSGNAD